MSEPYESSSTVITKFSESKPPSSRASLMSRPRVMMQVRRLYWIVRHQMVMTKYLMVIVIVGVLGGCALTQAERDEIIESAASIAADRAGRLAFLKARDAGLSEEASENLADLARTESRRVAERIASAAIPKAVEEKRSKWGALVGSVLMALLQIGVAAAKSSA